MRVGKFICGDDVFNIEYKALPTYNDKEGCWNPMSVKGLHNDLSGDSGYLVTKSGKLVQFMNFRVLFDKLYLRARITH